MLQFIVAMELLFRLDFWLRYFRVVLRWRKGRGLGPRGVCRNARLTATSHMVLYRYDNFFIDWMSVDILNFCHL